MQRSDTISDLNRSKTTAKDIKKALTIRLTKEVDKEIKRVNETLKVHPHVDPEYILWENIAYTDKDRRLRRLLSIFVAILFIGATSILVNHFNQINEQMQEQHVTNCVKHEKVIKAARHIMGKSVMQEEILHCYCLTNLEKMLHFDSGFRDQCSKWL